VISPYFFKLFLCKGRVLIEYITEFLMILSCKRSYNNKKKSLYSRIGEISS